MVDFTAHTVLHSFTTRVHRVVHRQISKQIADAMLKNSAKKSVLEMRVSSGQRPNYMRFLFLVLLVRKREEKRIRIDGTVQ